MKWLSRNSVDTLRCCVLLAAVAMAACGEKSDAPATAAKPRPAVPVVTHIAETTSLTTLTEAVGTLVGNESVTLTAKVTEQVRAVHFEGGELVETGQVLVELIDAEQLALLQEAEANLRESELQLNRLRTLGKEIATAAEIDVAIARVDANKAMLEALRSRINDRSISAPFTGIVGFRQVSVGALVTPGTVIAELDDIDPMKLDFTLPEPFLSEIKLGDTVTALSSAWHDEPFTGQVSRIGSRVDPVTRAFPVRALLDNSDARLRPGMLMTVQLALGESMGIVIPETALVQRGSESAVFTVGANNEAQRVSVSLGRRLPGAVEITAGLEPGDRVVVRGHLGLRPGMQVKEADSSEVSADATS
ncbi:MAG: efflux RND transporter periplasmic adaptor subunit [Halieaceae bacterium]|jgi:membrane fusion protein (multidrug efflux system)|nr:efflux RND transporter periplasmic adaptor subunit [Halieaceae bacterium]